ncbi:hypothetical protein OS493_008407 [Desmophyllum pertusum]|uniref:Uncharacterized protein n=1 Tax=Desmophyllum pertusum TaxID=174260 RepID=A0A9X0A439_9CNID|nr:hypothetical protein OS493_008407 [Desmophyllum pertusum]
MRLADFSSPGMRHFQNDALKTIAKYLKRRTRERLVNVLTTCGHTARIKAKSISCVSARAVILQWRNKAQVNSPRLRRHPWPEGLTNETGKDELEPQQISVLTNFDFLYDDEAEDVLWGPEYEDRRLSFL